MIEIPFQLPQIEGPSTLIKQEIAFMDVQADFSFLF